MTVGLSKSWMFRFFLRNFRLLSPHYYTVICSPSSARRLFSDPRTCDLERPLDMIQGVLYWLWRCVGVNKCAVFSVHKRSIIDYIAYISVVLNVLRLMNNYVIKIVT